MSLLTSMTSLKISIVFPSLSPPLTLPLSPFHLHLKFMVKILSSWMMLLNGHPTPPLTSPPSLRIPLKFHHTILRTLSIPLSFNLSLVLPLSKNYLHFSQEVRLFLLPPQMMKLLLHSSAQSPHHGS